MIKVETLPNESFAEAKARWLAGETFRVAGGDVLPKGANIRRDQVACETVVCLLENQLGFYLQL